MSERVTSPKLTRLEKVNRMMTLYTRGVFNEWRQRGLLKAEIESLINRLANAHTYLAEYTEQVEWQKTRISEMEAELAELRGLLGGKASKGAEKGR